jgi:acyl-CoA synthetase (AMP-forming)/AMP-acid ligase II
VGGWNFADVWEAVAGAIPERTALVHGSRRVSWAELDRRADGVAGALLASGAARQDRVAIMLHNGPEYLETVLAAAKVSLVPVNTNYRYGADELLQLWDNADAVAVVLHARYAELAGSLRHRLPRVRSWLWVDDGTAACPAWATPFEAAAGAGGGRTRAPWGRDGDDLILLYTGGTTGAPKGVMWRQDDLFVMLNPLSPVRHPELPDLDTVRAQAGSQPAIALPAAPLMHGTAFFTTLPILVGGGTVVTLTARSFDVTELLDTVEREQVTSVTVVGEVFARPILVALEREPDRWDLSSLRLIISSGVMWSEATKQGLLRHLPGVALVDAYGSSEALGVGHSVSTAETVARSARFELTDGARVIDDRGREITPGSATIGRVAIRGRQPLGYHKDEAKTAATFPVIDGVRHVITGDYARVNGDGSITLLGRGSVCINSGGEKVFPEEVEEVLKRHPAVDDAAVVGVPDATYGEVVTALVSATGGVEISTPDLIDHVRLHLAGYKVPRHVVVVSGLDRAPNGKLDYRRLQRLAADRVSPPVSPHRGSC